MSNLVNNDSRENDYIISDKLRPLLNLIWDNSKIDVKQGHLYVNNHRVEPMQYRQVINSLAYLLNTPILVGMDCKISRSEVTNSSWKQTVKVIWYEHCNDLTITQFFNDTSKRRTVNKKDIGSSKNGMLYQTFVRITGETPSRASRIPISKYTNRLVTGEITKFGHNGYKLVNKSVENFHIPHAHILSYIPHEFTTRNTQVKHLKRTSITQRLHTVNTEPLHSESLQTLMKHDTQPFSNACQNKYIEKNMLKELPQKGYYNKHTDELEINDGLITSLVNQS